MINKLLDIYNDYAELYKMFGDEYYKEVMEESIRRLKIIVLRTNSF